MMIRIHKSPLHNRRSRLRAPALLFLALILSVVPSARAQSPDEQIDIDQHLRGMIENETPQALEQYIKTHPPSDAQQSALYEVARARMQLKNTELPAADRAQAVDRLIAARRDLIDKTPTTDWRRAVWTADLATELLFDSFNVEGIGVTALFGLPTLEQRERAASIARDVLSLSQSAEAQLAQALLNFENTPNFDKDFTLQQRRRELIDRESQRRLPFLRGVGLVLNAELHLTDNAARQSAYSQAVKQLTTLIERLQGAPAIVAQNYLGLALARLGQFEQAETLSEAVAKNPSSSASDSFTARMGGVINRTIRNGPQSGIEALQSVESRYAGHEPANLFFRVLIADHRFLLRARIANQAPADQQQQLASKAVESYTDLMNVDIAGASRQSIRAIALSRMALGIAHLPQNLQLDQLPPIVRIAHADHLAGDPSTREQAIIALESELSAPSLAAPDRAAALFILGKALLEQGHHLFAAQRFIELASNYSGESQAETAIELGLAIAADLHQKQSADEQTRATLQQGITTLLEKYPNLQSVDRWRYTAGQLALAEQRFDDAAKLFSQIAPDAEQWLDANFMQAAVAHAHAAAADAADSASLNQNTIAVLDRVMPIIEKALPAITDARRASAIRYYLASLRIMRAEVLIALNRPQQALELLANIETDPLIAAESSVIGHALNARISAYQKLNKPEAALQDLTRFFEASPDQAPQVIAPMLSALANDVQSLINHNRQDEADQLAQRTLRPIAELLHKWLDARGTTADIEQFALPLAQAYRLSGKCDLAQQWYRRLSPTQADSADAILGRAECLFALGGALGGGNEQNLADAIALYKRLIAAGRTAGHDHYWQAQLRTLQILDRVNRRTEQIMPQIERLKQEDPTYGGERFRQGFDALRRKYTGKA
jgi:hypothetical protein